MSAQLDVLAVAARTPVGLRAETSAAAVRAGLARLREFPYVTAEGEPMTVATDPRLDDGLEGRVRLIPMLEGVLDEVRAKLGTLDLSRGGAKVWLALPETRPGFDDDDARWVVQAVSALLRARQIVARVTVAGRGHAGALAAVDAIATGAARAEDAVHIVLGVDSYIELSTFAWLEAKRRFAQPAVRSGFVPAEGAGALVVVTPVLRRRLGRSALATVAGVATAQETQLPDSDAGSFGVALSDAVRRASAGLPPADRVYSDINGERYRSEEWGLFAMRAPETMRRLEYEAPSDCWGDVGAAFGTLAGVLGVQSLVRGYAPGPTVLVTAGSDGGLRGAMVLGPADSGPVYER